MLTVLQAIAPLAHVPLDDGGRYDLILANSAYHHIEDHRKPLFMQNAARLLALVSIPVV